MRSFTLCLLVCCIAIPGGAQKRGRLVLSQLHPFVYSCHTKIRDAVLLRHSCDLRHAVPVPISLYHSHYTDAGADIRPNRLEIVSKCTEMYTGDR